MFALAHVICDLSYSFLPTDLLCIMPAFTKCRQYPVGLQASDSAALVGFQPVPATSDQPEKENCSTAGEGNHDSQQAAAAQVPSNKRQKRTPNEVKPPKQPMPKTDKTTAAAAQTPSDLGPPPEPTEYAKNRPRRETGRSAMSLGHTTESLELVKCCDFVGPPGCGAPLAQPFQVEVEAQVCTTSFYSRHITRQIRDLKFKWAAFQGILT